MPYKVVRELHPELFFSEKTVKERIARILEYATLAPSTHNSQPWRFHISGNSCRVYVDRSREIVHADPLGRDLYISMGALLQNARLASEYFGVYDKIVYVGEKECVAEVLLKDVLQAEKVNREYERMMRAMINRRNARGTFEKKKIPEIIIRTLRSYTSEFHVDAYMVQDEEKILHIAFLTGEGLRIAYENPIFRKEMSSWINHNFSKKTDGIPGYSLGLSHLPSFVFPHIVKHVNIGKLAARLNIKTVASAPLIVVFSGKNETPISWMHIGECAQAMMLELTAEGIATSIFAAAVEMGNLNKQLQEAVGCEDSPQFLFCAGYIEKQFKAVPRHRISQTLLKTAS